LLIAGAADGSLVAQHDPRSAAIALFGAVNTSALTYLITDNTLNESLAVRTSKPSCLKVSDRDREQGHGRSPSAGSGHRSAPGMPATIRIRAIAI
jgi:hypothetical protein